MKEGKLTEPILKRSVLRRISYKNPELFQGAGVGMDAASMKTKPEEEVIFSTDTTVYGNYAQALYGITKTENNLAAAGGVMKGVLLHIMLAPKTTEGELNLLMKEIAEECKKRKVQILGGHTETVPYVTKTMVVFTGVGTRTWTPSEVKSGMEIVMTKEIALEGTAILSHEREKELLARFQKSFVERIQSAKDCLSVAKEAEIATKYGTALMHDVSTGGIFSALWELSSVTGLGLQADLDQIALRQESVELCELFELNPYELMSGGALLIVTENGSELVELLEREGIPAHVIGRFTQDNDKVILKGDDRRHLESRIVDELVRGIQEAK